MTLGKQNVLDLKGWLEKEKNKGGRKFGYNLTKRWFVVENIKNGSIEVDENVLCYYKNEKSKQPKGWFFLSDVKRIEESSDSLSMKIYHPSRTFTLVAPDAAQHKKWLNGLIELCLNSTIIGNDESYSKEEIQDDDVGPENSASVDSYGSVSGGEALELSPQIFEINEFKLDEENSSKSGGNPMKCSSPKYKEQYIKEEANKSSNKDVEILDCGNLALEKGKKIENAENSVIEVEEKIIESTLVCSSNINIAKNNRKKKIDHRLIYDVKQGKKGKTTNARIGRAIQSRNDSLSLSLQHESNGESSLEQSYQENSITQKTQVALGCIEVEKGDKRNENCGSESFSEKEERENLRKIRKYLRSRGDISSTSISSEGSSSSSSSVLESSFGNEILLQTKSKSIGSNSNERLVKHASLISIESLRSSSMQIASEYINIGCHLDESDSDYCTDENEDNVEIINVSDHRKISFSETSMKNHFFNSLNSSDNGKGNEHKQHVCKSSFLEENSEKNFCIKSQNQVFAPDENFVTEDWDDESEDTISIQKQLQQSSCADFVNEDWDD